MSEGHAALAIGLAAAGVLSIATRDTRSAIVAVAVVAVVSPVLAADVPEPLPLAARLVAGLLAAYLLWVAVRGHPGTTGSPLGLTAEAVLAVAAGLAGYAGAIALPSGGAMPEAVAAGVALLTVGAAPMLASRDALRGSVGALLVVHGAWLVRDGVVGPAIAAEELALAVLIAALGAGGAALIARARGATGTLDLGARRAIVADPRGRAAMPPGEVTGRGSRIRRGGSPSA